MTDVDWLSRARALKPSVRDFINGRGCAPAGGESLKKFSPRDGSLLYELDAGQPQRVNQAVEHARTAYADGRWSKLTPERRKAVLYRLADLIERHREEFALLESLDVGKPITDTWEFDVPATAAKIRYSAEAIENLRGKVYGADSSSLSFELRRPVGVVAGIVGWNFPMLLAVEKIAPALATGNCLVLKPSELTSLSTARMAALACEAGLPDGVLNVVHGGPQVGAALARHADVDLLTFTGSSQTGKRLLVASGESNMKRLILECGGKAPNIVFDDCSDLDAVARRVVRQAFWNQGEVCSASSRLLVQSGIREEFLACLVRKTAALRLGDPLNPTTEFGALVSREHRQKVLGYIESGEREGARTRYRSQAAAPVEGGYYIPPVVFDEVAPAHKIAQEEIFGPVLSVIPFEQEDDAIRIANSTIYGLTATLWTKDLGRAHRVTRGVHAGLIVVNASGTPAGGSQSALPVGGHKQSGLGTEGGLEGLEEYLSRTAVQIFV